MSEEGTVAALRQVWRVLDKNGTLLDLRPVSSNYPIEFVTAAGGVKVGEFDGYGIATLDAAADRAVQRVVDDGWFVPRQHVHFETEFCWDTIGEMASFMEESRRVRRVTPSLEGLDRAYRDLSAGVAKRVGLRCRRPMMLATYRKGDNRRHEAVGALSLLSG